jgi:hypothetical protein
MEYPGASGVRVRNGLPHGFALVVLALSGASACGLALQGTSPPDDGNDAGVDATSSDDVAAPSDDASVDRGVTPADGSSEADVASSPDSAPDTGPCPVTCGGACVPDCNGCPSGGYNCHGTCVSGCDQCGGDFVVCLVCPGGGSRVRECTTAQSGGCLDGTYDHCPCSGDNDCPEGNQRCSGGVCTACGESQFDNNHSKCNQGCCCKSGASVGRCTCTGCGSD